MNVLTQALILATPSAGLIQKVKVFQTLTDKLAGKLAGWKQRALSLGGRTTIIKAVAMSIPSYVMQTFLLPTQLYDKMDSMVRHFWWGSSDHKKSPKISGGLGIKRFRDINIAFITKLGWKLCTETERIWVQSISGEEGY